MIDRSPQPAGWAHVRTWVFDLDNTLYHPSAGLLDQVNVLMTAFIADRLRVAEAEANRLRRHYWESHGATITGLVTEHGVDPDEFLDACHRLDMAALAPDPALSRAIAALPGRRIVHTNGPRAHAGRVLDALGLGQHFERVITIEDTGYVPKPAEAAHRIAIDLGALDAGSTAMIDDMAHNLQHPAAMGMTTVWLNHADGGDVHDQVHDHVHHPITDLTAFLDGVTGGGPSAD